MKSKHLLRIIVLLAMLFSVFGSGTQVQARDNSADNAEAVVVVRSITYWDATYTGNVNASRYELWPFDFAESNHFTITAAPTSGDLVPALILLDVNGDPITSATGSLNSTQPAGSYAILVQPETGGGTYNLTIRKVDEEPVPVVDPSASVVVDPSSINVGESAAVTVNLENVPAEGYTSAEFTCSTNSSLVEISNIADSGLFGDDAVMVVNGPQMGGFIVALAGSNGNKATTSGAAFTFSLEGLTSGQMTVECTVRVSKGDQVLTSIPSTSADLTIALPQGTFAGEVHASKPVTVSLYNADSSLAASVLANPDGTFSLPVAPGTYTAIASAEGFLDAQGAPVITSGNTTTLPTISLPAGDIDNNGVIDQFDALTIGMSYNGSSPAAADLNNDGTINVLDLELLAANYHQSGALAWQ